MINILTSLLLCFVVVLAREERKCPCDNAKPVIADEFSKSKYMVVCVHSNDNIHLSDSLKSYKLLLPDMNYIDISFQLALNGSDTSQCNVIVKVVRVEAHNLFGNATKLNSPGECSPVPSVTIEKPLEDSLEKRLRFLGDEIAITASLTMGAIRSFARNISANYNQFLEFALGIISIARYNECNEYPIWLTERLWFDYRRKIRALVIYIGSSLNQNLVLEQQLVRMMHLHFECKKDRRDLIRIFFLTSCFKTNRSTEKMQWSLGWPFRKATLVVLRVRAAKLIGRCGFLLFYCTQTSYITLVEAERFI